MLPHAMVPSDQALPVQFLLAAGAALLGMIPIGAVTILTVQRAISLGFWRSFLPTLGAITADGVFGVMAALGSGYLGASVVGSKGLLKLIGSVVLAAIGVGLLRYKERKRPGAEGGFGLLRLGLLKLTLVLSNPLTLGFYVAAFAALGLESPRLLARQSLVIGGGTAFGTMAWFLFICEMASRYHLKLDKTLLGRIRSGVGILFIVLAIVSAASAF